ncbi:Cyclic nucleotide-binding domain-containing protein [Heracleum sosnowskyi]|uniref:Cyclic nucleotide-binding domain-containing protein n=1 Tax=Heracleum sosnowskyi TaxID=360622 RepID=A0AAD8MY08_9APIA|nr:Cyclic nucleotide-binding domain-containing protein [Heracleum sosnowskyi]
MAKNENRQVVRFLSRMPSSVIIPVNPSDSNELPDRHHEDAKAWARRTFSSLFQFVTGRVIHPHAKTVQKWNKFFIFLCLFTILLDSLFVFLLYANQVNKCIGVNQTLTKVFIILRSQTSLIYLLYMLHNFRLAYFAHKSQVLVNHPKTVALKYLSGHFLMDFFVVLPLFQVYMWLILEKLHLSFRAHGAAMFLAVAIVFQYLAMLYRVLQAYRFTSFIFQSWWALCFTNLFGFVFCSHLIGTGWYFLALQRVKQCLRNACGEFWCYKYVYCGQGNEIGRSQYDPTSWKRWEDNNNATACFGPGGFKYGIYWQAVNLTTEPSGPMRYIYSLFWGFQQISTLAGNQTPTLNVSEVFFTMCITATGLLLFSLLIGDMQNFLQALGRRNLEMSVRHFEVEVWMSRRKLPGNLRKQVRESERYHYAATRGINELTLLEKLPEDLQRDIRRHLFKLFVKKIPILAMMDEPALDAIRERMKQKTYIKGSKLLDRGCLISKTFFIARGELESVGEDKNAVPLSEGDVCGEELFRLGLEHSALNKNEKRSRIPAHKLVSSRTVTCLTNVRAYTVQVADLEEVFSFYSKLLFRNPLVEGVNTKKSHFRQGFRVNRFKLAWRIFTARAFSVANNNSKATNHKSFLPVHPSAKRGLLNREKFLQSLKLKNFTFDELSVATRNFHPSSLIGPGGFGFVFKGWVDDNTFAAAEWGTGLAIAVKRLSYESPEAYQEWLAEINSMGNLCHPNVVRLIGYSIEKNHRLLVYDFMPQESLDKHLLNIGTNEETVRPLDWPIRFKIINGIARGILYLHQSSRPRVIHRHLRASNILLDSEMNPKVSDFGFARILGESESELSTMRIVGTDGCMSPEYAMHGTFSVKSDVYSFGVLLLEIVTGMNCSRLDSIYYYHPSNLPSLAWRLFQEEKCLELLHTTTRSSDHSEVSRAIQVGLLCVQSHPEDRPSMSTVVSMLTSDVKLPKPKRAAYSPKYFEMYEDCTSQVYTSSVFTPR